MTRESARLLTENAMRLGHVGLDHAGDDVDRRPLRRDHEVDADGPRHLRDAADARLDVACGHHHEVVELVDDDHDERQALVALAGVGIGLVLGRQLAAVEHRVVAGDVAHTDLGEQLVAHVHLAHGPVERVRRLLRVGDDLGEQVREVVVGAELDPLGVDEDEAHLVGRVAHQQRRDDRVDAAGLARAGRARDEHVRERGDVEHHRLARDVAAEADAERRSWSSRPRARRARRPG